MSPLPQRKKSPEEIARLRETLGIPGGDPAVSAPDSSTGQTGPPVDTLVSANHEATIIHEGSPASLPKPALQKIHSLKRSEQVVESEEGENADEEQDTITLSARGPKPVRSLRKSEWIPVDPHPEPPLDSSLPLRRHSDDEIAGIRRREALSLMNTTPNPKLFPAHPGLIIPGYLSAIAGAVGFYFYQFPIAATLACVSVSLAMAVLIFIRKPVSRHHAAFISVISLFVLVFGALHYFPYLRHAT